MLTDELSGISTDTLQIVAFDERPDYDCTYSVVYVYDSKRENYYRYGKLFPNEAPYPEREFRRAIINELITVLPTRVPAAPGLMVLYFSEFFNKLVSAKEHPRLQTQEWQKFPVYNANATVLDEQIILEILGEWKQRLMQLCKEALVASLSGTKPEGRCAAGKLSEIAQVICVDDPPTRMKLALYEAISFSLANDINSVEGVYLVTQLEFPEMTEAGFYLEIEKTIAELKSEAFGGTHAQL